MADWQKIETAPKDGTVIEAMNTFMQFPVDVCWGEYTSPNLSRHFGKPMRYAGWHSPYTQDSAGPTHWRLKTTADRLFPFRLEPIVEFPPLPSILPGAPK